MQGSNRIDGTPTYAPYPMLQPAQPSHAYAPQADSLQLQPLQGLPQTPAAAAQAMFQPPERPGQPPSALTHYATVGARQHKRPMTFSLMHVAAGVRPLHINSVSVKLECDDLRDPSSPCFLVVCGHTENGLQVAVGGGAYGMSTSIYGGGSTGDVVRFARRIDSLQERQQLDIRLHNAGTQKQRRADFSDLIQAPAVEAIDGWKVGEYLEHTGTRTGQMGWLFGNTVVQKLDVYGATENHRSVCIVKSGDMEATVSVTPIQLKTAGVVVGNKLEQNSWWRTRTLGQSEVFRYDLGNALARAQLLPEQPGASYAPPAFPLAIATGIQKVQQLTLKQHESGRAMTAFGGRVGYTQRNQSSTLVDNDLLTGTTTETQTTSQAKTRKRWDGGAEHDRWEVSRVKALQGGQRTFQRMVITKQCALASGATRDFGDDGMPLEASGRLELANDRNQELAELSDAVLHAIPQFEGQQWPSTYAVRLAVTLTPDDIDQLSRLDAQQVVAICQQRGDDPRLLEKVVACFAEMAQIEQKYEQLKWTHPAQYAAYDDQATHEQSDKLHALLGDQRVMPHIVRLLAVVNAATGAVRAPVVQVACREYDDADEVVSRIDALSQLPSPIQDERALEQHFKAHTKAVQSILRALLVATTDTVSMRYDRSAWESSQDAWRDALERLIDAESAQHVAQLPEAELSFFRKRSEDRTLFSGGGALKYASLPQQLEVVLRQFNADGRNNPAEREVMAELINALQSALHQLHMKVAINRELGPVYEERRDQLKAVVPQLLARLPERKTEAMRAQLQRIAQDLHAEEAREAQGFLPPPPPNAVWSDPAPAHGVGQLTSQFAALSTDPWSAAPYGAPAPAPQFAPAYTVQEPGAQPYGYQPNVGGYAPPVSYDAAYGQPYNPGGFNSGY